MPLEPESLYRYGKLRNPLNHMTVMFKKEDILSVGGYKPLKGLEDYFLWSRLLAQGFRMANCSQILVHARLGRDFSARRGGFSYFSNYRLLRRYQFEMGYTNRSEYIKGLLASAFITLQPPWMRRFSYRILRNGNVKPAADDVPYGEHPGKRSD